MSDQGPDVSIALIHHPVYDQKKSVVATNITNFDIHDISRVATSFAVHNYFIVHPIKQQLMFVERVLDHRKVGTGAKYNPKRRTALSFTRTAENLDEVIRRWDRPGGLVVATSARQVESVPRLSFRDLRAQIHDQKRPCLLLFGTGFGLAEPVFEKCQALLEPIRGAPPQDYRHLSVRSAVSICLDRLLGSW